MKISPHQKTYTNNSRSDSQFSDLCIHVIDLLVNPTHNSTTGNTGEVVWLGQSELFSARQTVCQVFQNWVGMNS